MCHDHPLLVLNLLLVTNKILSSCMFGMLFNYITVVELMTTMDYGYLLHLKNRFFLLQ